MRNNKQAGPPTLWNCEFRSREQFPSPRKRKEAKPIIVQLFPEVEERINEFCSENIGELTIEKCQEYVNYTVLPSMHVTYHDLEPESCKWKLLNRNLTGPPSLTTIWRWMLCLGWRYSHGKKTNYVDGHE